MVYFRNFSVMIRRDLRNLALNPVLLMSSFVFPLLLIIVLGYMTTSIYGGGDVTSYDYYGVTILVLTSLNVSMIAANSFMEKSLKTSNLRVLHAPIPTFHVYGSKIFATLLFTVISTFFLLSISHFLLGINCGGRNWLYVAFILVMFNFFSAALGVMFCCIFKSEEITNKILSLVNNTLAVIGGLFFQLDGLGRTAEMISYVSPVKWITEAIFRIIYDHDLSYFWPIISICAFGAFVLILCCKVTFNVEDYV